jgi:hypothetical protein
MSAASVSEAIVVVNAGSTSLKFAAYAVNASRSLPLLCRGEIESMENVPHFVVKNAAGKEFGVHEWAKGRAIDHKTALHFVITWLEANLGDRKVVAAGHRIVLGGSRFEAPVRIDSDVLAYLDSLVIMEPSHQPYNVLGARALAEAFPGLPQVACFDRGPRIIAVAGNLGHLWGEQHRIETRTKPNHLWVNSGRLTIGGNYSRSPTARSIGRCRRCRRPTRCPRTCATRECVTGATMASPTNTSAGRCRSSHRRRGA